MCGIGGIVQLDKRKVFDEETRLDAVGLLNELQKRGSHSWGVYIERKNNNYHLDCGKEDKTVPGEIFKIPGEFKEFLTEKDGRIYLDNVHTILMHTRASTHGSPLINYNNHPFNTKNFILSHNGIIRNDDEIKKKFKISTEIECDSFFIVSLIQHFYDKGMGVKESIQEATKHLEGGYACWLYHKDKREIYLFRNPSNPIEYLIDEDRGLFWFSSEDDYIVDTYKDKTKVTSTNIQILSENKIFKLSKGKLLELAEFIPKKLSTWSSGYGTTDADYDTAGTTTTTGTIVSTEFDKVMARLYKFFSQYDASNSYNSIVSSIRDTAIIMIKSATLNTLLQKYEFKSYIRENIYKKDWTRYVIPRDKAVKMIDSFLKIVDAKIPPHTGSRSKTSDLPDSLIDLASSLGIVYYYSHGVHTFETLGLKGVPEDVKELFKKQGYKFGKDNRLILKNSPAHRKKLSEIVNAFLDEV